MSSYIPERIFLYCKKPEEQNGIRHAFPVSDNSGQSRHENAERWAMSGDYDDNGAYVSVDGDLFEFENSNFESVTIEELEIRGQGGRAYQVTLEHDGKKFNVDLREDALMDVIKNTGIQPGGKLNGTFCFIVDGSQTNLIREHSKAWESAKDGLQKRNQEVIKKKDLKIGHKYRSLSGETAIYFGEVFSRTLSVDKDKSDIKYGKIAKKMIFISGWYANDNCIEDLKNGTITNYYSVSIKSSHSYKEDLGKVIDIKTEDFVNIVNNFGQKEFDKSNKSHSDSLLSYYSLIELSNNKDLNIDEDKIRVIVKSIKDESNRYRRFW